METALIGLCSAIIGGIVALLGMKQRWKEIAENSAQQIENSGLLTMRLSLTGGKGSTSRNGVLSTKEIDGERTSSPSLR